MCFVNKRRNSDFKALTCRRFRKKDSHSSNKNKVFRLMLKKNNRKTCRKLACFTFNMGIKAASVILKKQQFKKNNTLQLHFSLVLLEKKISEPIFI